MGRELKSNVSLKRKTPIRSRSVELHLPCYPDTPIPVQFVLKEEALNLRAKTSELSDSS